MSQKKPILLDTARANLTQYTRQVAQDRNVLQLLLGAPLPEQLSDGPPAAGATLEAQSFLEELPAGLPSDLLERRTDILSAEDNLGAANVRAVKKTIQTAFREVAEALVARGSLQQQLEEQRALVNAASASYKLSDLRFQNGVDAYLTVWTRSARSTARSRG